MVLFIIEAKKIFDHRYAGRTAPKRERIILRQEVEARAYDQRQGRHRVPAFRERIGVEFDMGNDLLEVHACVVTVFISSNDETRGPIGCRQDKSFNMEIEEWGDDFHSQEGSRH